MRDDIVAWRCVNTPNCCVYQHCWYLLAHMPLRAEGKHATRCVCFGAGSHASACREDPCPCHLQFVESNSKASPGPVLSSPSLRKLRADLDAPPGWLRRWVCRGMHVWPASADNRFRVAHFQTSHPHSCSLSPGHCSMTQPAAASLHHKRIRPYPHFHHPSLRQTSMRISGRLRVRRWSARGSRLTCCHHSGPVWHLLPPSHGSR